MSDQAIAPIDVDVRLATAHAIVKRNALWAAGAGVLPFPLLEFAAITAVEVKLVNELADHYHQTFRQEVAKTAIVSLVGSLGSVTLGKMLALGALRFIPVLGPVVAVAATPGIAAAITYAVGKVFTSHFEAGGSLLDFDPVAMREHFRREFAAGMKDPTVAGVKPRASAA
jgi:uncharacterized protein (DUF697 family)